MMALTVLEYHFGSLAQSRNPHALGQNLMPFEHAVEALLEQHVEGFSQPIEHWQRRRIGEIPRRVCFYVVAEIKVHPSAAGGLLRRQRPGTGTDDAETSGKHEPFLRSSDSEIHTPTRPFGNRCSRSN